jgi:uncharacterized LabA/DUF88 family protein
MSDWIYVDNSNVLIEGQRASAVQQGMALDTYDAMTNRIIDTGYRVSLGKLYQFIAGMDRTKIARAVLFRSKPLKNDPIWEIAKRAGFEIVAHDRNATNKEQNTDTDIVLEMLRDAYRNARPGDVFTIISGDSDFIPLIKTLRNDGFQVDVVYWDHAARELRETCSNYISLNPHLEALRP